MATQKALNAYFYTSEFLSKGIQCAEHWVYLSLASSYQATKQ